MSEPDKIYPGVAFGAENASVEVGINGRLAHELELLVDYAYRVPISQLVEDMLAYYDMLFANYAFTGAEKPADFRPAAFELSTGFPGAVRSLLNLGAGLEDDTRDFRAKQLRVEMFLPQDRFVDSQAQFGVYRERPQPERLTPFPRVREFQLEGHNAPNFSRGIRAIYHFDPNSRTRSNQNLSLIMSSAVVRRFLTLLDRFGLTPQQGVVQAIQQSLLLLRLYLEKTTKIFRDDLYLVHRCCHMLSAQYLAAGDAVEVNAISARLYAQIFSNQTAFLAGRLTPGGDLVDLQDGATIARQAANPSGQPLPEEIVGSLADRRIIP